MKTLIFAVDFDGTCVTHEFPKVGRDIGAQSVLKELIAHGHKLILWTMRSDNRPPLDKHGTPQPPNPLSDAVAWFEHNSIPLHGVNRNPDQDSWTSSPKAYANYYIDDAAIGVPLCPGLTGEKPFVDWEELRAYFIAVGFISEVP